MTGMSVVASRPARGVVTGYRCATCGAGMPVTAVFPFRCPAASAGDHHHVLHPVVTGPDPLLIDDPNPFVRFGPSLAWWAFATSRGMTPERCIELTREVAAGFAVTPCAVRDDLSERIGVPVWVKDETGNVGGSHKARHLVGILAHLRAAEELGLADPGARAPLAIASCGNAAIAAATLAARAGWPLQVYVPDTAGGVVLDTLSALGAQVHRCARHPQGPPGDPAVHAFRAAVARGAIPFSVQGPENGLCLDGGRTLGWELADALPVGTRVFVQVGGGALAACVGWGLGPAYRVDLVQTEGGAPLARAWAAIGDLPTSQLGARWAEFMTPWPDPHSLADGILDDETYDWLADVEVLRAGGGRPIVVPETVIAEGYAVASATGIPVSPTGSAGLAGLLQARAEGSLQGSRGAREGASGEAVAVIFSGVRR